MIDQLTQEQQWGWAYQLQQHNKSIASQNVAIEEANGLLPDDVEPQPLLKPLTMDEYMLLRIRQIGDAGMREIERVKWERAKQMFAALTPEQQEALIAQFGIPDVIE